MSLEEGSFAELVPSRFTTFTYPNPTIDAVDSTTHRHLRTQLLRIAVLDSPTQPTTDNPPRIAAMIVPDRRETDWNFSTQTGHLQLLHDSPEISRLILIGNLPSGSEPTSYTRPAPMDPVSQLELEEGLTPLVLALCPKSSFQGGLPATPFLTYEDDVIRSVVVDRRIGGCVGELMVEDVEWEIDNGREFRRRLRFKRMPNLIQTQIRIFPNQSSNDLISLDSEFELDMKKLVHPYLTPMVAGLSLISSRLEQKIQEGFKPSALCLGVGGGALLTFLNTQLGFQVIGVENDEVVLDVARHFFGLQESENLKIFLGDWLKLVGNLSRNSNSDHYVGRKGGEYGGFDVVMVDLDSSDAGTGTLAPPLEFTEKSALLAARMALAEHHGALIVNVVPSTRSFYETLIQKLQEIFVELYEIDVGNGENFVLVAATSPVHESANSFRAKLGETISGEYLDSIRKV